MCTYYVCQSFLLLKIPDYFPWIGLHKYCLTFSLLLSFASFLMKIIIIWNDVFFQFIYQLDNLISYRGLLLLFVIVGRSIGGGEVHWVQQWIRYIWCEMNKRIIIIRSLCMPKHFFFNLTNCPDLDYRRINDDFCLFIQQILWHIICKQ